MLIKIEDGGDNIPETKLNAVKHALQATFGVSEYEDIRRLTTGLTTALVFRIIVQGNTSYHHSY